MSAVSTMPDRRVAVTRNTDQRRKLWILGVLALVLVALLAFQLPKLLKGSSASTATATVATPSSPAVGATVTPVGGVSPAVAARRLRVIRRMEAKDPFVPLVRASAAVTAFPAGRVARAHAKVGGAKDLVLTPVQVKPAAPTAAVIWANGQRQVVGLSQTFSVGDVQFRLVAVTRKAMRIKLVGAKFADAKRAISVRKGHRVKLVNTATGVAYRLLFTRGATNAPSTSAALASATAGKN